MRNEKHRVGFQATTAAKMRSVWFVIFMAVVPSALQLAIRAADQITLWQVYGHDRMAREHLRITKIKPRLVVSNGDVLSGGFRHYLISMAIWSPLSVGVLLLIFYLFLPKSHREVWQGKEQSVSGLVMLWGLALFVLSVGLVPLPVSLMISVASIVIVLIWAYRMHRSSPAVGNLTGTNS